MNRQAIMLVGRLLALALISCAGCVDSTWRIAPDSPPSQLWQRHPRTSGWDGVDVWYWIRGAGDRIGDVQAHLRSRDDTKRAKVNGRFRSCESNDLVILIVNFDGVEERNRLVTGGHFYVLPATD
jgi:hypothetical protein